MMNAPIVSPAFIKQKVRQLRKKDKSLSQARAFDKVTQEYGFSNYKHYLNCLEASSQDKENLLKSISLEKNMVRKMELAVSFIQEYKIPFNEQLNVLKFFQGSHELGKPAAEWMDDVHFVCAKLNLMDNEI